MFSLALFPLALPPLGGLVLAKPMEDDGDFNMHEIILQREENFTMDRIILERSNRAVLENGAINTCECAAAVPSPRIVGGKEVDPRYRLPYQALVYPCVSGVGCFLCGGTIVNKKYIITAAHCTEYQGATITNVKVAIGEQNICDGLTNEGGSFISAKRVINHPNYGNHDNDIAVLELSKEITFTDRIKPACLPTSETKDYSGWASTISGWGGTIAFAPGNRPQQPPQCELKESFIQVLSLTDEKCSSYLKTTTSKSKLCAWAKGTDTCQGDSGGPLTVAENGKFVLIGVVSYGSGCAHTTPGVYARVQGFLPWIKSIIADGECGTSNSPVETGSVESDNHPEDYPANQDKTYHISVSAGRKIKITFAAFSLEEKPSWSNSCAFDYLKIVDSNGVTILGESCGSEKPAEVTSQTNQVILEFHSDYSVTSTGFKIDWVAV